MFPLGSMLVLHRMAEVPCLDGTGWLRNLRNPILPEGSEAANIEYVDPQCTYNSGPEPIRTYKNSSKGFHFTYFWRSRYVGFLYIHRT